MQSVFSPFYLHVFGASALASRLAHTLQLRAPETLPAVFRMVSARRLTSLLQHAYCANAQTSIALVWQSVKLSLRFCAGRVPVHDRPDGVRRRLPGCALTCHQGLSWDVEARNQPYESGRIPGLVLRPGCLEQGTCVRHTWVPLCAWSYVHASSARDAPTIICSYALVDLGFYMGAMFRGVSDFFPQRCDCLVTMFAPSLCNHMIMRACHMHTCVTYHVNCHAQTSWRGNLFEADRPESSARERLGVSERRAPLTG